MTIHIRRKLQFAKVKVGNMVYYVREDYANKLERALCRQVGETVSHLQLLYHAHIVINTDTNEIVKNRFCSLEDVFDNLAGL